MLGIFAFLIFLQLHAANATYDPRTVPHYTDEQHNASPFRIIIDVGSTGSRLHIFEFVASSFASSSDGDIESDANSNDERRVQCLRRGSSKAWTPLSTFASEMDDGRLNATHVAHHMLPLFDYATIIIPPVYHSTTPVRISCTAGMRLLPPDEQNRVYDALFEGLREQSTTGMFPFTDLKRENVFTLDGEREGFFGAVAANYLRGVVDAELKVIIPDKGICTNKFGMCEQDAENVVFGPSRHYVPQMHNVKRDGPLGALDMGGSSTQIVYRWTNSAEPSGPSEMSQSADEHVHVPSHLDESEFFSTSFLSYGADQFRERLWNLWVSEAEAEDSPREPNPTTISNPCNFAGYRTMYRGHEFVGSGNAHSCKDQINRLIPYHHDAIDLEELYDENEQFKSQMTGSMLKVTKRKMVGSVKHPPIRGKFYGMSLYFFTLDCLRELSDHDHPIRVSWPTPSIEELTHALDSFCARSWSGDIEYMQHEHTRAEVLPHRCFEAVYMVTLLRDGFGFHPSARDITFTQWVEGNEVEWSLGMALSEYAADRTRHTKDEMI